MKARMVVCLAIALCSSAAMAQRINVSVSSSGDDPVGQRLAYQVKEEFRRSSSMAYQEDSSKSAIVVHLVTLRGTTFGNESPASTVYSVAWTIGPQEIYYDSSVGICGGSRIASCAEQLVARTDEIRETFVRRFRKP